MKGEEEYNYKKRERGKATLSTCIYISIQIQEFK